MLPEERFLSLCRLQHPGDQLVSLGSRDLSAVQTTLALGALMGPGRRRPSHAQSCFPTKENTLGVAFRLRRTPTKQQGPGSQRQPSPALPNGERPAGCEKGLRCFPEQSRGGAGVCSPRSFSCPFADCRAQELGWCLLGAGPRCCVAEFGSGRIAWALAQKVFAGPILLPREGEHVGSWFQAPESPSQAAEPREPVAAQPRCARQRAAGWVRKLLALLS